MTTGQGDATGARNAGACSRSKPRFHRMPGNPACIQSMLPSVRQMRPAQFLVASASDNPLKIVVERSVRALNCSSRRAAYTPEPPGSFRAKQLSQATFKVLIEPGYSFHGNALRLFVRWSDRLAQKQILKSALCSRLPEGPCGVNFCEHDTRVIEIVDERLLINWSYFCGKSGSNPFRLARCSPWP